MSTVQPSNNSELQLYRVLQRANLLPYFETFITQGGDDVQQLCEAGEDEFLEIMALVGMASKPLHVRRLQKALQEWVSTPSVFEASKKCPTHVMSITCSSAQNVSPSHSIERTSNLQDYKITPSQSSTISTSTPWSSQARDASPSDGSNLDDPSSSNSPQGGDFKDIMKDVLFPQNDTPYSGVLAQPVLLEHQISAIAAAAALLAQELPSFEPKSMPKKQISKDITKVMMMSLDEPGRMNAMRRYAAIYGRFDSKRKNHRPMSSHEISVNEAAAQLCSHIPALLTRREELFPLARQVVRDSGYQYSKGHSRYEEQGAAEILIQPKLEEGDTVATTSSSTATSVISEEDSFNDLQSELTQITLELSELTKEQNRIRSALRVLLEMNDHEQMKSLTAEMDDLNDRQTAMNKRRQRIVQAITKYRKGGAQSSLPAGCTTKQSPRHSPLQGQLSMKSGNSSSKHNSGCYGHSEESSPSNPLNTLYMAAVGNHKDSLFEEGLRIATQYGMSDFAQELIGMKSTKEEVEDKDCGLGVSTVNSVLTSSGESVTSSSSFAVAVNGQFMQLLPSSLSSSTLGSDIGVIHTSRSPTHSTTGAHANVLSADNKNYHPHSSKIMASSLTCVPSVVSNDESVDDTHVDEMFTVSNSKTSCGKQIPTTAGESSVSSQDSTATTTTTKSSHFLEVETRRSSRRKNGEPDYYLINGGEKRFRSGNVRRSSSTSSEQARRLSSSSSPLAPGTLAATSPTKNYKLVHQTNEDEDTQTDISDLRSKSRVKVNKMTVETNQLGDDIYDTETNT